MTVSSSNISVCGFFQHLFIFIEKESQVDPSLNVSSAPLQYLLSALP